MKVQATILAVSSLLSVVAAFPAVKRDSAINEPAVEAPNGTPITLTPGSMQTSVDNSNSNSWNSNNNQNSCSSGDCGNMQSSSMDSTSTMNSCSSGDCSTMNSCSSGDCNTQSSSMMMDSTSTMDSCSSGDCNTMSSCSSGDCMQSSSMMMDTTSTMMYESSMMTEAATSTWMTSYATATYGSGYTPSSYDSCVQQCINSYGAPPSMVTATPSMPPSYDNGASGTGATHTVIVAPTQGVLRYVPFAVNASVGDTVRFVWNAGPHTVTKSSALNLCNATMDKVFKSGMQNKSFVFDQVINDTTPTFYYCGVPGHCEKGMFGIINPPNAEPGAQNTAQGMMAVMAQNNSDFASQWSYTVMNTTNSTAASNWGMNMDVTAMTTDPAAQMALLQNVMFTRLAMAVNDKFVTPGGGFNPNPSAGMAVPMDPLKLVANGTSSTTPSGSDNASSPSGSSTVSTAPAASSSTGAARRTIASSATAFFAAVAIAALVL